MQMPYKKEYSRSGIERQDPGGGRSSELLGGNPQTIPISLERSAVDTWLSDDGGALPG